NIVKNLKYYGGRGRNIDNELERIETIREQFDRCTDIAQLMGREGLIRRLYYRTFERILQRSDLKFEHRSRRPPSNEVNALISFANSMVYSASLSQLYHTQLSPAISFLHEPGARRFSLALDLAEIFKPLLADRLIFSMLNRLELKARDFDRELFGCLLKKNAREKFVRAFDTRLKETIQHRTLHRSVSYRHLIRLECYKIEKHILGIEQYDPFVSWW
ncbi:MAG: CRISPR-associated endonuclease Cas1, partial [Leptospiraceae bacterium]|nr:CRISPR-associated endonuclease Cas1 [Leptospiraceae bacterium]